MIMMIMMMQLLLSMKEEGEERRGGGVGGEDEGRTLCWMTLSPTRTPLHLGLRRVERYLPKPLTSKPLNPYPPKPLSPL